MTQMLDLDPVNNKKQRKFSYVPTWKKRTSLFQELFKDSDRDTQTDSDGSRCEIDTDSTGKSATIVLAMHAPVERSLDVIKVQVCVQFFKVGEIDTLKEQYTADVIVRARWREPTLDGKLNESGDITDIKHYWNPKLYIENSYGDPKEMFRYRVVFNEKGEAFMSEKRTVKGTFMENLELDDFPFDVQDLTITVASEFPYSEVEVIEDWESRHMVNKQSFVDEQEWHLYAHTECLRRELMIDQFDPNARRSAISVKCRAARRPGYFIWNIFMVTFLICSLSFATFSVHKSRVENRLQLSFTLVLTAVAFKSVVNQSLPRISYLTYMDKYLLASMIMLSAVCTWHGLVTMLSKDSNADYIESIVLGCLGVVYFLYNVGFCIMIYLFPCRKRRIMSQKDKEHEKAIIADEMHWYFIQEQNEKK